jgi:hypothetical protein
MKEGPLEPTFPHPRMAERQLAAGAWRDYHGPIHARLPFVHSCTPTDAAVQEDLRRDISTGNRRHTLPN